MIEIINKTKYPTEDLGRLAKFAIGVLPVDPVVYVGSTSRGWHGLGGERKICVYLSRRKSYFPRQYGTKYCFKNSMIPDCLVDWDDAFVEACAHEYFHSFQKSRGLKISEADAEAYGINRLLAFLKLKGVEPKMKSPLRPQ